MDSIHSSCSSLPNVITNMLPCSGVTIHTPPWPTAPIDGWAAAGCSFYILHWQSCKGISWKADGSLQSWDCHIFMSILSCLHVVHLRGVSKAPEHLADAKRWSFARNLFWDKMFFLFWTRVRITLSSFRGAVPEVVSLGYLSNCLLLISGFMGCFKAIVNSSKRSSDNSAPSSWQSPSLSLVLSSLLASRLSSIERFGSTRYSQSSSPADSPLRDLLDDASRPPCLWGQLEADPGLPGKLDFCQLLEPLSDWCIYHTAITLEKVNIRERGVGNSWKRVYHPLGGIGKAFTWLGVHGGCGPATVLDVFPNVDGLKEPNKGARDPPIAWSADGERRRASVIPAALNLVTTMTVGTSAEFLIASLMFSVSFLHVDTNT